MTNDEIIAPGKLVFGKGWVDVHEVRNGQVYYHIRSHDWDIGELKCMAVPLFIEAVRREGDVRRAE